jgi:hypothetical protein
VAEQSAKAVIFRFMFFSALSTRHEPTGLYIFSLLLYADGNRLFKAKPPQASLTGFVRGRIQFDPREFGGRVVEYGFFLLTNRAKLRH